MLSILSISRAAAQPEMAVNGNGKLIANGDNTPGPADFTDFGVTSMATGLISRTFTILNQGNSPLQLNATPQVLISGPDATYFTVGVQPPASVNAAESVSFTLLFNPDAARVYTATVFINSNDSDENPYSFTIKGSGEFDIRDCTDPCTGNDVTVDSVEMRNETGDPFPPVLCSVSGTTVLTTLFFTINNHTSANRRAIRVAADIFIDGVDGGEDVIFCYDGPIAGNSSAVVPVGPFAYSTGHSFELRNFKIAWRTSANADCFNSMECNSYPGGQCTNIAAMPDFVVITPLSAGFASTLPPPCATTLLASFKSTSGGGIPPYTYSWNFGDPASGANNTATTSYATHVFSGGGTFHVTLTITDNNGTTCTTTTPVEITPPTVAVVAAGGTITCKNPTLILNGSGSSTGLDVTYQWTSTNGNIVSGANTLQPVINQAGTYTLLVTNLSNGCTGSANLNVSADQNAPYANAGQPQTLTCADSMPQLQGSGSAGPGFSIQWTANPGTLVSGINTYTPTVSQAGVYTLVVTNLTNGCTSSASVPVGIDQTVPLADAGASMTLSCQNKTVQLQGSGSSGPGYVVQWTAAPGFIINGANTYTPAINQTGTYHLTVTNTTNGCTNEAEVKVMANFSTPVVTVAPPGVINCYNSTVQLSAGASSQGSGLTFSWTTTTGHIVSGGDTPSPVVDQGGTYLLTVTATSSGCTTTASVVVLKDTDAPVVNAGAGATLNCSIAQLILNGSAFPGSNLNYSWQTTGGYIVSGANTLHPLIDSAGTYTLRVTNTNNGCTGQASVTIGANYNTPVANAGADLQLTCNNTTVTLSGNGSSSGAGITHQWVANPGSIVSGANTLNNAVVNAAGRYVLLVVNTASGCTDEDEVVVDDLISYPVAAVLAAPPLNCTLTSIMLDAGGSSQGGSYQYAWTTPNGHIAAGTGTLSPQIDQPGTYQLLVTNTLNGCTATATVTVTQDISPPVALVMPAALLTCVTTQIKLNGNGSSYGYPFVYQWTTANGRLLNGQTTLAPTVDQTGTYTLTVINTENGCTAAVNVVVSESKIFPVASAGPAQDITCTALQLTLNGSGSSQGAAYSYVWSTQNGHIVSGKNTLKPVVDAPGTYLLTVIHSQTGCTATSTVSIGLNNTVPQAVVAPGGLLSCVVTTLALDGSGSSPAPGHTYQWTGPTGAIVSGQGTLSPVVNAAGLYQLVVTNTVNGCTSTATTTVTIDASVPVASAGLPAMLNCITDQLTLNGSASSQGPEFTYTWTGPGIVSGANTLTPVVDAPGGYRLLVTDISSGCTAVSNVNIPADIASPVAEAGPNAVLNCATQTLTLDGSNSSIGPEFIYAWTASAGGNILSGQNSLSPKVDRAGTYTLQVTNNNNGCTASDVVNITEDKTLPVSNAGSPGMITCTNATVQLNGSGSTGPDFSILWTTPDGNIVSGANTFSPVVDAPGTYYLWVTNSINGCTASASVQVSKDVDVPVALVQPPPELNCAVSMVSLDGTGSTSGADIQFSWTTANGHFLSDTNTLTPQVDAPGQYTLHIFNTISKCEALFTVEVDQDLTPPVANAGAPAVLSCSNPTLTLDGSGSSQGMSFTYQWTTTDGNILSGSNTLSPDVDRSGMYTLVVTYAENGCTASSSVQILLDQNSPQAEAGPGMALTCTTGAVTLNSAGTSTNPNFTIQWSASAGGNIVSGPNSLQPVVDAPGTYTLLVTNPANGCISVDSVKVVPDMIPPAAAIAPPAILDCQTLQTTLNTNGSSSGVLFAYKWTTTGGNILSGANGPAPVVNKPGSYQLLITNNANGCTATTSTSVLQDITPPVAGAGQTAQLDCAITSLTLNGSAGNAGTSPQYAWSTAGGHIVAGANTLNPSVDAPGLYALTVTNSANHCSATAQVTISQDATSPLAVIATAPALTCAVTVVNLNAIGSSAGSLFNFQWAAQNGGNILSGANTLAPAVDAPGEYLLSVTNTHNHCTATAMVLVQLDTLSPTANAGSPVTLTCTASSLQLDGSGSSTGIRFQYGWTTLVGLMLSGETTLQPLIGAPGMYTLIVSDIVNGCTSEATVTALTDAVPPVAAVATPGILTCSTTMVTLNGTGSSAGSNYSYLWTSNGGQISSGANTPSAGVTAPGVYALVVTNSTNGCTTSATTTVFQNITPPTVIPGVSDTLTCAVTQVSLSSLGTSASGKGISYAWSTVTGSIVSGANTPDPVVSAAGLYFLTVTDLYNGCTGTTEAVVPVDVEAPPVSVAQPEQLTCTVLEVLLDAGGSAQGSRFTYTWSGPSIIANANTLMPTVNQPGVYQLQVYNNINGCSAVAEANVPQDIQLPIAEAGPGFELTCSVSEGHLSVAGSSAGPGFTYLWSTPDGNILSAPTDAAPLVNGTGFYYLLVTNTGNGCTATDLTFVTENTNYPSALQLLTDPPGCDGEPGMIQIVEVFGGTGPYLYSIDNGYTFGTADQFEQLSPGQYHIVIQDANGCEYTEYLYFPELPVPNVQLDPEISLAFGDSATLTAYLDIPLYEVDTIIWAPAESLTLTPKPHVVIAKPFSNTVYTVTVVNKYGCEDRASIAIKVDDPHLWAPNAISSNQQDGKNDVFLIFAGPNTVDRIKTLQIYDRWGNMVFRNDNIQPNVEKLGWNGYFRGKPMNPAVFVWWAEVELLSGRTIIMKGDVTIVD